MRTETKALTDSPIALTDVPPTTPNFTATVPIDPKLLPSPPSKKALEAAVPAATARAVVATAASSNIVASAALGPAAANRANNVGRLGNVLTCGNEDDDDLGPEAWQSIPPFVNLIGSSTRFGENLSSLALTSILWLLFAAASSVLSLQASKAPPTADSKPTGLSKLAQHLTVWTVVLASYFAPTAMEVSIAVAVRGGTPIAAVLCSVVVSLVTVFAAWFVAVRYQQPDRVRMLLGATVSGKQSSSAGASNNNTNPSDGTRDSAAPTPVPAWHRSLVVLLEASAGSPESTAKKLVVVVEFVAAVLVGAVSGARAPGNCQMVAVVLLVVSLGAFIYLVAVRPYTIRLEQILAAGAAALQAMLAVAVLAAVLRPDLAALAGWVELAADAFFMGQLVVVAAHAVWRARIRGTKPTDEREVQKETPSDPNVTLAGSLHRGDLEAPLLVVPPSNAVGGNALANPLVPQ